MCVCESNLTGVCPAVCFEVGALGVHFVAAGEVASVNSPLFQCVRRFSGERMLRARMNYYRRVVTPIKREREREIMRSFKHERALVSTSKQPPLLHGVEI